MTSKRQGARWAGRVGVFLRRLSSLAAALVVATLLAACSGGSNTGQPSAGLAPPSGGGGGSSGGSSGSGSTPPSSSVWNTRGVTFDPVLAQQLASSTEFRQANADCLHPDCGTSGPKPPNQSSAYDLHKVHLAHSGGSPAPGRSSPSSTKVSVRPIRSSRVRPCTRPARCRSPITAPTSLRSSPASRMVSACTALRQRRICT